MVLFSEGIAIPPAVHRLFLGVIDAANRANVSIYTMDAAGLRTESEQAKIRDQVNEAGKRGLTSYASTPGRDNDEPLDEALEKNEDVLRQDPHTGLGELAQGTGGLIFDNTNNLRPGFDRVESDLRNYYLIGYTPTNPRTTACSGRSRSRSSGPASRWRRGKGIRRAQTGGGPVNTWEAPALGALDRPARAERVPVSAPEPCNFRAGTSRHGAGHRRFEDRADVVPPTEDQKTFKSDFAVVVRFLNPKNQVVRKSASTTRWPRRWTSSTSRRTAR